MTDTSLNPLGAGYFDLTTTGASRQQFKIDGAASGSPFPFGTVVEIENFAGPGTTSPPTVPLITPSSTTPDTKVIGVISAGLNYQGLQKVAGGQAAVVTTQGLAQVLCDATTTAGQALVQSPTTAGAAQSTASPTSRTIGVCLQAVTISSGTALVWAYINPGTETAGGGGVALSTDAGALSGDVSFAGTLTSLLSTASLAIGTWIVHASFALASPALATEQAELEGVVGTATATITGQSTGVAPPIGAAVPGNGGVQVPLSFRAVVTVAGTLTFKAQADASDTWTALAASGTHFTGHTASGYTAIKVG